MGRLISLVENGAPQLAEVMGALIAHTGRSYVVGVTGPPGAGKSTLVDNLISRSRQEGRRVAVLAVDPTSPFSGGALLGDRVRMQAHATDAEVFIRSMAARGHLGGLALATLDAVRILDAWGAERVFLETVGVGQSEVEVMDAADSVVVVLNPGWGDGVQANKAGLLEIADLFVVNKADRQGCRDTVRELNRMLDMGPERPWRPPVVETVGTSGSGTAQLWAALDGHRDFLGASGQLAQRRRLRLAREITRLATRRVAARIELDPVGALGALVERAGRREIDPWAAASELLTTLELDGL